MSGMTCIFWSVRGDTSTDDTLKVIQAAEGRGGAEQGGWRLCINSDGDSEGRMTVTV